MISFCCPSRGRPKLARRLIDTAQETAKDKFEIMLYLNDDDPLLEWYQDLIEEQYIQLVQINQRV